MKNLTRRDFLKLAGIGTAGVAATLALASCSKDTGNADTGDKSSTGTEQRTDPSTVTVLLSYAPDTHPWIETWRSTSSFPFFVAQHLADIDYNSGELYGVLAKSLTWNEDKTVVDIELYDNITDSDGNPFTANDLHWMYTVVFANDAAYVRTSSKMNLDGCKVVDDTHYHIEFIEQSVQNEQCLNISCVTQAAFEADPDGFHSTVIGTGPYVLSEYTSGVKAVFTKRDDYWGKDLGRYIDRQNVDTIVCNVAVEASQRTIQLKTGEADMDLSLNTVDIEEFKSNSEFTVYEFNRNYDINMFFNHSDKSPCKDKRVRQAIAYAIDNDALVAGALDGYAQPARSLITHASQEWTDDLENNPRYTVDLEKAKSLLADAGYGDGLELTLVTTAAMGSLGEILQAQLAQVGITVKIDNYDNATLNTAIMDETLWDLNTNGTAATTPNSITRFTNGLDQKTTNRGFLADDKLQQLIDTAKRTGSIEDVSAVAFYAEEEVHAYALYDVVQYVGYRSDIGDYKIITFDSPYIGGLDYSNCGDWLYD